MRRTRRFAQASIVAVIAAALVTGPVAPLLAEGEEIVVSATTAQGFSPKAVDAKTGTTIIWRNDEVATPTQPAAVPVDLGVAKHKIVSDDGSFESPVLISKASWSLTFNKPTSVAYRCAIHPQLMTGSLSITGPVIKPEPLEKTVKIVEGDPNVTDSYKYDPKNVLVQAGTTIMWRNEGSIQHTVTADDGSFDSGLLDPGATFTRKFKTAAALRYHCDPHPWMTGLVRVAGKGGQPPPPPPPVKNQGNSGTAVPEPTQERTGTGPTTFGVNVVEPSVSDPDSWGFSPVQLTARVGDTVKWTNTGSTIHSVTADAGSFDSGNLDPEGTFEFVLENTGTLAYHCTPHPWMKATVVVQAASAAVPNQPGAGTPVQPPPDAGAATPDDPATVDESDPAAGNRRALAFGAGAAIVVLGAAFILPVLLDRRRRAPSAPRRLDLTDVREPVGV